MSLRLIPYLVLLLPALLLGQAMSPITIPAGTPFPVELTANTPLRVGEPVRAALLYDVYADNERVLPARTVVTGTVVALTPDKPMRNRSRMNGDFTPFSTSVVHFTDLILADRTKVPIVAESVTDGGPVKRVEAKPKKKGGLLRDEFDIGVQSVKDGVHFITDPGKGDRAKQLLYSQLPYHPQRIAKGTSWTFETDVPLLVAPQPDLPMAAGVSAKKSGMAKVVPVAAVSRAKTWTINAYLREPLSSESSTVGEKIHAIVAEPIYNDDHTIAVPQGSVVTGYVTKAKPSKRFGRAGDLQFDFRELELPDGDSQTVQTTVSSIDSAQEIAMNSEGKVQQKPKDKIMLPLLLGVLATRPLDQEGGPLHQAGKNGLASNSVGLVGFIVGIGAQAPNIATGIGAYGAALSIYDRWIKQGQQVTFARDTRVVLQTTPRSTSRLTAASQ